MRRDPVEYDGQEVELVYIAASLGEAHRIESILDNQGIDYTIEVEHYRSGIIFASVRAGAFFYVALESAGRSRETLKQFGYKVQEPLL